MIGLKRGTVKLVPHNLQWTKLFEEEKKRLSKTLGNIAKDIQHIGSTAIPGITAKPIIDIAVAISSLSNPQKIINLLEDAGYTFRKEVSSPDRLLFVKGKESNRTHHISIVEINGNQWKDSIFFRDYLISHSKIAKKYDLLKKELADKYKDNRGLYTKNKERFLKDVFDKKITP